MNVLRELSKDEVRYFLQKSDRVGFMSLAFNWGLIALAFAMVAIWPSVLTVLLALTIIAGRQLGLAILMHDCAHYSLFRTRKLNDILGQWLCASPILISLPGYRKYHMDHHSMAGTTKDPDYPMFKDYPVSKDSMRRKITRDLTGITGIKNLIIVLKMSFGLLDYQYSYQEISAKKKADRLQILKIGFRNLFSPLVVNLLLWFVLYLSGHGWLYLLWPISYLTVYMLFLRIRNAAEHAAVPDLHNKDPRLHTRTTIARWWERLTVAPNFVNYHMEHHLVPAVPGYRLKELHQLLRDRGYYQDSDICQGYGEVMRKLTGQHHRK